MNDLPVSAAPSRPTAVCVLGMHRSGTSALTGLLGLLGVELGRNLVPPGADNPKGYWEHSQIVSWHMGVLDVLGSFSEDFLPLPAGWETRPQIAPYHQYILALLRAEFSGRPLWGFKDPRTCRTLPLWHTIFDQLGVEARYVLVVRNPGEVADSMGARAGCPYNQALLIGLGHTLEAERHTRGRKRVWVAYEQLIADWRRQVGKITESLGIRWPRAVDAVAAQANQFLDAKLRHHRGTDSAAEGADPLIAQWAFGVHRVLSAAAEQGIGPDEAMMDQIGDEFRKAAPGLNGWRPRKLKAPTV